MDIVLDVNKLVNAQNAEEFDKNSNGNTVRHSHSDTDGTLEMDTADALDVADAVTKEDSMTISVDFVDTEPIEIPEIVDTHGRLSDIIESFEDSMQLSVIPLKMAGLTNEVSKLSRHEIFTFADEKFAFSQRIRKNVCDRYIDQIVANLSGGVPYTLQLVTTVTCDGKNYITLLLSRKEWTYILSKFRKFVQKLSTDNATHITLYVTAERI